MKLNTCYKHNGKHEYEGDECPVCRMDKLNGNQEYETY